MRLEDPDLGNREGPESDFSPLVGVERRLYCS